MKKAFLLSFLVILFSCKPPRVPNLDYIPPADPSNPGVNLLPDEIITPEDLFGTFEGEVKGKLLSLDNQVFRVSITKGKESKIIGLKLFGYCTNTQEIDIAATLNTNGVSFVIPEQTINQQKISGKGYFNSKNEIELVFDPNSSVRIYKISKEANQKPQPPVIEKFFPENIFVGEDLQIIGKNFNSTLKIFIDEKPAGVTFMTKELIKVKLPELQKSELSIKYSDSPCANFTLNQSLKYKTNKWIQADEFPGEGRMYALGTTANGKGYIGLGATLNDVRLPDLWQFDPKNNTWERMPDFIGVPRTGPISFSIDDKLYIGGGFYKTSRPEFYEFNTTTRTWRQIADLPGIPREHGEGFAINGKGYVVGGKSAGGWQKDVWEYNPTTNEWSKKSDIPGLPRSYFTHFVYNGKLYLGSGLLNDGNWADEWYEFNPEKDTWALITKFKTSFTPRSFVLGDLAYTIYDSGKKLAIYDLKNNLWRNMDVKENIVATVPVLFQIDKKVYFGTGFNGNYSKKMWQYVE